MTFNKSNVIVSGSRSSLNEYANYTTVFPKPVTVGDKIVLTQDMINKQNVKYIIKWNFDLDDETITVPEGCLIEFDGGSFSNGTLVGNETILVYNQEEEDVFKNVSLEGSFERSTSAIADKMDNTNGMAKIYLKKNKPLATQLTQPNTIYVIQYDFVLGEDITVPANCVLEFDGGSIYSQSYSILFNNTLIKGVAEEKILTAIDKDSTFKNHELKVDWFVNDSIRSSDCADRINELFAISCRCFESKYKIIFGPYVYNIKLTIGPEDITHIYYKKYLCIEGCSETSQMFKSIINFSPDNVTSKATALDTMIGSTDITSGTSCEYHIKNMAFNAAAKALYTFKNRSISNSTFENVLFMQGLNACFYTQDSYCFSFKSCIFRGLYSDINSDLNVTHYGLFMGQGTCNAVNIYDCKFRGSCVGIYCGNGYNFNIIGCTLEGNISTAIAVSFCENVNIDGCYFEDNGEGRNRPGSLRNSYVGVGIKGFSDNGTTVNYSTPEIIKTDIIIGVGWLNPATHISDSIWAKTYSLDKKWKTEGYNDIPKNVSIKNCSSERLFKYDGSYIKRPSFIYACCCRGLDIDNCSLTMQNPSNQVYELPDYHGYILSILAINHKLSTGDIVLNNNTIYRDANIQYNIPIVYLNNNGDNDNYVLSNAVNSSIYPYNPKVKTEDINYNFGTGIDVWYGRNIQQVSAVEYTFTLNTPKEIKTGDIICFDFFNSLQSFDIVVTINNRQLTVKGDSIAGAMNKYFYNNVIYISDSDFTLSDIKIDFTGTLAAKISDICFAINSNTQYSR